MKVLDEKLLEVIDILLPRVGEVNGMTAEIRDQASEKALNDIKQIFIDEGWPNKVWFNRCFVTKEELIDVMNIGYGDGMDIGLFDLHQQYDRKDM